MRGASRYQSAPAAGVVERTTAVAPHHDGRDTKRKPQQEAHASPSGDAGAVEQRDQCFRGGHGRIHHDYNHGHGQ